MVPIPWSRTPHSKLLYHSLHNPQFSLTFAVILCSHKIYLTLLKRSKDAYMAWSPPLISPMFEVQSTSVVFSIFHKLQTTLYKPLLPGKTLKGVKTLEVRTQKSPIFTSKRIEQRFHHCLKEILFMADSTMRSFMSQRYFVGEVAPSMMRSQRRCSSCPRLETIFEEGCSESSFGARTTVLHKRAVYLFPVFFSFISYILLYRLW